MYVPENVVDNDLLSRLMDTSDEWIRKRTGIEARRLSDRGQATSDLAVPAARAAMEDAGIGKEEIDYLVFATMTPDYYFPGSGSIAQRKVGLPNIPCLDIRQQCCGFLYGLQLADSLVRSGTARNVLLVGAESHCGFMPFKSWDILLEGADHEVPQEEYDWNTRFRDRMVLFGDGAGAAVISGEETEERGILDCVVHADGNLWDKMWVPSGGTAYRPYLDEEMVRRGDHIPIVVGREVFKTAVTYMPDAVNEVLKRNGMTLDDVDLLIMHQANLRINEAIQKRLGLPDEKVFNNIQKYGNTTAATIPMAFHEAKRERNLAPGSLICFVALGSGLNWGAALYRI
jgi:3-oxoacyl-[acyl-carrier-protein] synthase-3